MNADALEDAVVAAVLAASGLPAGKVFWSRQTRQRPARPFIELDSQDIPDNQHEEQTQRVNPSPTADAPAVADVAGGFPGTDIGGTITTVAAGVLSNHELLITITPGAGPFPNASFNPIGGSEAQGLLTINCGPGADVTPAQINTLINTGPLAAQFVAALTGTDPIASGLSTNFLGGSNGADWFLIDNVTHPELTIQLRCFSADVRGSSSARAILKATSKKLGGLVLTEQLDAAGIAVITRGTIQDVSLELQNEFEGRAVMGLIIRTADKLTESVDRFEKVTVETTIDRDDGNPPVVTTTTYD